MPAAGSDHRQVLLSRARSRSSDVEEGCLRQQHQTMPLSRTGDHGDEGNSACRARRRRRAASISGPHTERNTPDPGLNASMHMWARSIRLLISVRRRFRFSSRLPVEDMNRIRLQKKPSEKIENSQRNPPRRSEGPPRRPHRPY